VKHTNGVTDDNYGLTLVDLANVGYKDDPWVLAERVAPDGNVSFQKPSTEHIYQKLEGLAEMQKKGLFMPDSEKKC
jgi:hypothetical protein